MKLGQIEQGIPIPKDGRGKPINKKYQFEKMQVGDSMVIKGTSRASAYWAIHTLRITLKLRKLKDGNYRVWRVG